MNVQNSKTIIANDLSRENQRFEYIDVVKGIGIILVIIGHHSTFGIPILEKYIYSFHMPLFFIITGYLFAKLKYSDRCIKQILKSRFLCIFWPYLTFSAIDFFSSILYMLINPGANIDLKELIITTVSTYGYHSLWFLPTLSISSVLFLIIEKRKFKYSNFLFSTFCMLVWYTNAKISSNVEAFWGGVLNKASIYIGRICMAIILIYIGSIFSKFLDYMETKINNMFVYIIFAIILIMPTFYFFNLNQNIDMYVNAIGNPILFLGNGSLVSISVLLICKYVIKNNRILVFFGKNSLSYMALHTDCSAFIVSILFNYFKLYERIQSFALISICEIILNITITTIFVFIINKYCKFIIKPPKRKSKNRSSI